MTDGKEKEERAKIVKMKNRRPYNRKREFAYALKVARKHQGRERAIGKKKKPKP